MNQYDLALLLTALQDLQGQIALGKDHRYRHDKQAKPGVTTIIGVKDAPALDRWKVRVQVEGTARVAFQERPWENEDEGEYVERLSAMAKVEFEHERIANEAADVGKQVHALIEHAVKEQLGQPSIAPEASDEALFTFAGWRGWAEKVGLEPLMAEGRIYHPRHDYCGTFDLLALVAGKPTILDWKPTPALWEERRLQSAAYRVALMDSGWPNIEGAIVCLPRDGGEIDTIPSCAPGQKLEATFQAFVSLLNVYRWQKEIAKDERKAAKEEAA